MLSAAGSHCHIFLQMATLTYTEHIERKGPTNNDSLYESFYRECEMFSIKAYILLLKMQ